MSYSCNKKDERAEPGNLLTQWPSVRHLSSLHSAIIMYGPWTGCCDVAAPSPVTNIGTPGCCRVCSRVGCSSCSVASVMLACFLLSPGLPIQCHFNLGLRTHRLASYMFPLATKLRETAMLRWWEVCGLLSALLYGNDVLICIFLQMSDSSVVSSFVSVR
jgi:hypothetical protein